MSMTRSKAEEIRRRRGESREQLALSLETSTGYVDFVLATTDERTIPTADDEYSLLLPDRWVYLSDEYLPPDWR